MAWNWLRKAQATLVTTASSSSSSSSPSNRAATISTPSSPANSVAASPNWIVSVRNDTQRQQSHGGAGIPTDANGVVTVDGHGSGTEGEGGGFTPFVAFCFTINYIVGTGFLTIPWAFVQGGLLFSTMLLVVVGIFADISKNYTLETMARAEAMLDNSMHWLKKRSLNNTNINYTKMHTKSSQARTTSHLQGRSISMDADDEENEDDHIHGSSNTYGKKLPSLVYSPVLYPSTASTTSLAGGTTETDTLLVRNKASSALSPVAATAATVIPYDYQSMTTAATTPPPPRTAVASSSNNANAYELSLPPTPETSRHGTPDMNMLRSIQQQQKRNDGDGCRGDEKGRRIMLVHKLRQHRLQHEQHDGQSKNQQQQQQQHADLATIIKARKFEVNTLCRVFLGKRALYMFTVTLCLYCYCTLWAYTSVFASAMSNKLPLTDITSRLSIDDYTCYAIFFALVVVPLSCMELNEQVIVQVTMTGCRFLMLLLMLSTSASCAQDNINHYLYQNQLSENDQLDEQYQLERQDDHSVADEGSSSSFDLIQLSGLHKMLPILVFALIFHHSIPGLAHPVMDKQQLKSIFTCALLFSTIAYSLLGLILGMSFGTYIKQSSNLNWNHFRGGTGMPILSTTAAISTTANTTTTTADTTGDTGNVQLEFLNVAWWAKAISLYIVCFPALDVLSAYPLNAITLGNNMMGAFYGRNIHDVENNRFIRTTFRLLASVPPIIFAILIRELGQITDYAGTTGFMIGFAIPGMLYLSSTMKANKKIFSIKTYYSSYASSFYASSLSWSSNRRNMTTPSTIAVNYIAWTLILFGIVMILYVVWLLVRGE